MKITLKISDMAGNEKVISSVSDENGRYEIVIPPYPPSYESYTMKFSCGGEEITFSDVLFGELYHISGQSNMELQICRTIDPLNPVIPNGNRFIREFRVPVKCCFGRDEEYDDFQGGQWTSAEDSNLMEMSAAGYYFAEALIKNHDVPIGLVNTSAGALPLRRECLTKCFQSLADMRNFCPAAPFPIMKKIPPRLTG